MIGNILLVITYRKKDLRIRFNGLMMTLAIFDFLYIGICFRNIVCLYFKSYAYLQLFYALEFFLFYCSVYTVMMICLERYLLLCKNKNTGTYSFFWFLAIILVMSILSSVQWMMPDVPRNTMSQLSIVSSAIPTMAIVLCKAVLLKRLRFLLKSGATNELRKAVFQAKISNAIGLILLISQIMAIINWILVIVIFDEENCRWFQENHLLGPLPEERSRYHLWENMYKCYAYLTSITKILKLTNCSVNFYVYQYLLYRNEKIRKQIITQELEINAL